jgi:hypothetical protein
MRVFDDARNSGDYQDNMTNESNEDSPRNGSETTQVGISNVGAKKWGHVAPESSFSHFFVRILSSIRWPKRLTRTGRK